MKANKNQEFKTLIRFLRDDFYRESKNTQRSESLRYLCRKSGIYHQV